MRNASLLVDETSAGFANDVTRAIDRQRIQAPQFGVMGINSPSLTARSRRGQWHPKAPAAHRV